MKLAKFKISYQQAAKMAKVSADEYSLCPGCYLSKLSLGDRSSLERDDNLEIFSSDSINFSRQHRLVNGWFHLRVLSLDELGSITPGAVTSLVYSAYSEFVLLIRHEVTHLVLSLLYIGSCTSEWCKEMRMLLKTCTSEETNEDGSNNYYKVIAGVAHSAIVFCFCIILLLQFK